MFNICLLSATNYCLNNIYCILSTKLIVEIMCRIYGSFEMSDRDILENLFFSDFLELSISDSSIKSSIYILPKNDKVCA